MSDSSTQTLHRQAIDAAINCDWQLALEFNLEIIKQEPTSIECLNRLAKAYLELGNLKESQKFYKDVLDLDPYNSIAQKNLKKISLFKQSMPNGDGKQNFTKPDGQNHITHTSLSAAFFVAEPGVTKSVSLTKVAEPQRLLTLSAGTMVNLLPKNRGISVQDLDNKYLGILPDDLAFHLLKLIKGGNKYQAFVQSVKQNGITILIREVFRSKKFRNQASFLDEARVLSYSSDHLGFMNEEEDSPTESNSDSEDSGM